MIPRYTRQEMGKIWEDSNRFSIWLEIEILVCEAHAKMGKIPQESVDIIREKASFDVNRIFELEEEVKHDVVAFLTNVAENIGPESRYVHLGMTSSDVLDTALAVQMKQAGGLLLDGVDNLLKALVKRAREHKKTIMMGRTHGIHAEPVTFGLKMALWYEEMKRNKERLKRALNGVSVGKISGAVGTYAFIDPFVEEYVCNKLGIRPEPVSTQIVQRDRHAEFITTLAVVASSLEKFATEIRHLQRTEVLEAEEYFSKGQKGSSAMPHKRNPITCERVTGLARILRGNATASLENVALWHERDISHSSVERVIIPDSCILLDYMLAKMTEIVEKLIVYPKRMLENVLRTNGLIFSQSVLLALSEKGMSREEAYRIVQENAMKTWKGNISFKDLIREEKRVKGLLSDKEINELFDLDNSVKHVDHVYKRIGLD